MLVVPLLAWHQPQWDSEKELEEWEAPSAANAEEAEGGKRRCLLGGPQPSGSFAF